LLVYVRTHTYIYDGYFVMKIRLDKTLVNYNERLVVLLHFFPFFFFFITHLFLFLVSSWCHIENFCANSWDVSRLHDVHLISNRNRIIYIVIIRHRNGQLHIGDQLVCINQIYLDSKDPTSVVRACHLLSESTELSIELVVITTIFDYPHAAVSSSTSGEHSCVRTSSTPYNVDMVVSYWLMTHINK